MESWGWSLRETTLSTWKDTWPRLTEEEQSILLTSMEHALQPDATPTLSELQPLIRATAHTAGWTLNGRQEKNLAHILHQHMVGGGPLSPLLNHSSIEEISITGIGIQFPVRVYNSQTGWEETPLFFTDSNYAIALLNRLARESGSRLSGETPILNARMQGGLRIHASIPPICQSPIEASIRRFTHRPTHPIQLLPSKIWSPEMVAYLETALACDSNLLIAGNTGSGKTTTLNALAHLFPESERIITIEETPELSLTHPHRVSLYPKSNTSFDMARLIRETLRMRPDRVIVGEIRFPDEAKAYMESILAGQGKGTYATFHGHSSQEALSRLKQYGLLEHDLGWINLLLIQRRWTQQQDHAPSVSIRRVTEIVELDCSPENGLQVNPVFTYNPSTDGWKTNPSIGVAQTFTNHFPHSSYDEHMHVRVAQLMRGGPGHDCPTHPIIPTPPRHSRVGVRN